MGRNKLGTLAVICLLATVSCAVPSLQPIIQLSDTNGDVFLFYRERVCLAVIMETSVLSIIEGRKYIFYTTEQKEATSIAEGSGGKNALCAIRLTESALKYVKNQLGIRSFIIEGFGLEVVFPNRRFNGVKISQEGYILITLYDHTSAKFSTDEERAFLGLAIGGYGFHIPPNSMEKLKKWLRYKETIPVIPVQKPLKPKNLEEEIR